MLLVMKADTDAQLYGQIKRVSDTELGDRPENAGDNWARNRKDVKAYKKKHGSV